MKKKYKNVLVITASMLFYLLTAGYISLPHMLIYNYTASLPTGWYWLEDTDRISRGDIVLCDAEQDIMQLALQRKWIKKDTHFLKYVYGIPGDIYEIRANRYIVNGEDKGEIKRIDTEGRPMPLLTDGKYTVPDGYLLIGTEAENSFDSRYYGPVSLKNVYKKAHYIDFKGWLHGKDL